MLVSHSNSVDTIPLAGNHATVQNKDLKIYYLERTVTSPANRTPDPSGGAALDQPDRGTIQRFAPPGRRPKVSMTHITLAEHR